MATPPHLNDEVDVDALQAELASLRKTCAVLKQRVESSMCESESSFATFERQAHLQRVIEERTRQLSREAAHARREIRERARVEALLKDSQRLAKIGGWTSDLSGRALECTDEFYRILETERDSVLRVADLLPFFREPLRGQFVEALQRAVDEQRPFELEGLAVTDQRRDIWIRVQARVYSEEGGAPRILGLISDISERKVVESRMAQSQRMESVGQLASGIAHEINTPAQFVSDNARFLKSAFEDLDSVLSELGALAASSSDADLARRVEECFDKADYKFLHTEIPLAVGQSLDGLDRITRLIRAMKDYAHPGDDRKEYADLNRAIESTATVARNEWKYVAKMEFGLDPSLPKVPCILADLNQVVLNMIVNAAHAIEDRHGRDDGELGLIRVATGAEEGHAVITIEDNGCGIPQDARDRIFDPFFTTKEVGRGTGQGLALSHVVIVERHSGRIEVDSTPDEGTRMRIWLPLEELSS
jgi:signal transduction histidine kinase